MSVLDKLRNKYPDIQVDEVVSTEDGETYYTYHFKFAEDKFASYKVRDVVPEKYAEFVADRIVHAINKHEKVVSFG